MSEPIGPMLVFTVTFLGITLVVMGTLGQLFAANALSEDIESSYDVIGGITYTMWQEEDYDLEYAYISAANVTDWHDWENQQLNSINMKGRPPSPFPSSLNSRSHFTFYDQAAEPVTDHRLDVWIVRNNTEYYKHVAESEDNPWLQTNRYRDFVFFRNTYIRGLGSIIITHGMVCGPSITFLTTNECPIPTKQEHRS